MDDNGVITPARVEVHAVITRACAICRAPRQLSTPCANCGNAMPAEQRVLGVISATYRNPLRRITHALISEPLARYRIRQANASTSKSSGSTT